MVRSTLILALLVVAACGSNGSSSGPCDVVPPDPACQLECDPQPGAPNTCPSGFYCSPDATCYAQCTPTGGQCGDGYTCTYDGHCQMGDPGTGSGSDMCPAVSFTAKPTTPSIALVVDKSGSMFQNNFGAVSRWAAVANALVDPTTGIVTQLQSKAYFGLTTYDCSGNNPRFVRVDRALNNAPPIATTLNAGTDTNSNTPTGPAIRDVTANFAAAPPPADSPPIIVLATDGLPNVCGVRNSDDRAGVIAATTAAYAAGIRVVPLSVAAGNTAEGHLQQVANIGAGVTAGQPDAPLYKANTAADLKTAFDAIIGGAVSCDLTVNGSVTQEQAAEAVVKLNGRTLIFNTEWALIGDRTIRLLGTSCDELKSSATPVVNGTFPCGSVIE
ncbi:MAG: vWA domain-containing protein [Kofleriaceae bacterium]